ncbi:AraC family transcriptional regulator [Rhodopila globiformis]|uniref:Uncharacterized protein n=1 Tax=Rhodopila globiformis TaxID=1071 RepID=A0A2S6NJR0_RHOGL|nr:AraC family transcriptional regulator [Rhodopila globiformis]PPQ35110.1 hypothetical protein CCS01_08645 [Rhodopila globiformis]
MLNCGSSTFADAEDYEAALPFDADLLLLQPGHFLSRLTWINLPRLGLLRGQESLSRVARVSLPLHRIFVIFPMDRASPLICDGVSVPWGDIMLRGPGERFWQRTAAASVWGAISLTRSCLVSYGRTLIGRSFSPPSYGQVLRLAAGDREDLLRLHSHAARLAETGPERLARPEIVRALEHDVIAALVTAIADADPRQGVTDGCHCCGLLVRLADVIATSPHHVPSIPQFCRATGVSERMLRTCCLNLLGISPARYISLRQRKHLRHAWQPTQEPAGKVEATGACRSHRGATATGRPPVWRPCMRA